MESIVDIMKTIFGVIVVTALFSPFTLLIGVLSAQIINYLIKVFYKKKHGSLNKEKQDGIELGVLVTSFILTTVYVVTLYMVYIRD